MNKYCYSQSHSPQVVFSDNSFLYRWLGDFCQAAYGEVYK